MTPQELIANLKSLSEAQKEASALITRLSKLSPSPDTQVNEADDRIELSAEIHQSLKEQEEELELLKQGVEDLTSTGPWAATARRRDPAKEQERLTLVTQVERLDEDLKLYAYYTHSSVHDPNTVTPELASNSAAPNSKPNATPTPPKGASGNSSSPASKKATLPLPVSGKDRRNYRQTSSWSIHPAT